MRRFLSGLIIFFPLLTGISLLFLPAGTQTAAPGALTFDNGNAGETVDPEKLLFIVQYIGSDYGRAVQSGRIVDPLEYREMLDFSRTLIEQHGTKARESSPALQHGFEQLNQQINQKVDESRIRMLSRDLASRLAQELKIVSYPTTTPDLAQGKKLYVENCAKCHGASGDGRGPSSQAMDPPPSSFQEERMNDLPPHQVYNAVTFGVDGTDMPSHQESLTQEERWDIAFYVMTLRRDFDPRPPSSDLQLSLKTLAAHSNSGLISQLSSGAQIPSGDIDYYRQTPPAVGLEDLAILARQRIQQSVTAYKRGHPDLAFNLALQAYLEGIEPLEPAIRQRDRRLFLQLEREFGFYRWDLRSGKTFDAVAARAGTLEELTERARQTIQDSPGEWGFAFIQSLAIILREGVEAALLVGLMITYLVAAGYGQLRKQVGYGAAAGIVAGVGTWGAAKFLLQLSALHQEALEGVTSLLAAAVLFSVSFWIIHHADIRHWKSYIRSKAEHALGTGSGVALAFAAFLAVYREAFETVLFYQAMWMKSATTESAVLAGFGAGMIALAALVLFMFRFGLRIPVKQFFAITGVLLGLLAFVFAGYGVRELQNIGWIKETALTAPAGFSLLEIHPTVEGLALQFGILLSFLMGWFKTWNFQNASAERSR